MTHTTVMTSYGIVAATIAPVLLALYYCSGQLRRCVYCGRRRNVWRQTSLGQMHTSCSWAAYSDQLIAHPMEEL